MERNSIIYTCLIILFLLTGCFSVGNQQEIEDFEKALLISLNSKYEKEFVVLSTSKSGNEGMGHYFYSEVKCTDDEINFNATYNSDNYLLMKWSSEASTYYQELFDENYGHAFCEVVFSMSPDCQIGLTELSFLEVMDEIQPNDLGSHTYLRAIISNESIVDKKTESEFIYELMQMDPFKSEKASYVIRILYTEDELEDIPEVLPKTIQDWEKIMKRFGTVHFIDINSKDEIISIEEIVQLFEKWESESK